MYQLQNRSPVACLFYFCAGQLCCERPSCRCAVSPKAQPGHAADECSVSGRMINTETGLTGEYTSPSPLTPYLQYLSTMHVKWLRGWSQSSVSGRLMLLPTCLTEEYSFFFLPIPLIFLHHFNVKIRGWFHNYTRLSGSEGIICLLPPQACCAGPCYPAACAWHHMGDWLVQACWTRNRVWIRLHRVELHTSKQSSRLAPSQVSDSAVQCPKANASVRGILLLDRQHNWSQLTFSDGFSVTEFSLRRTVIFGWVEFVTHLFFSRSSAWEDGGCIYLPRRQRKGEIELFGIVF